MLNKRKLTIKVGFDGMKRRAIILLVTIFSLASLTVFVSAVANEGPSQLILSQGSAGEGEGASQLISSQGSVDEVKDEGASKLILSQGSAGKDTDANGFIIINHVKEGKTVIQVQVRGLETAGTYQVFHKAPGMESEVLGELKVNKFGSGHFHGNLDYEIPTGTRNDGSDGYRISIKNTQISNPNQVLFTWMLT